MDRMLVFRMSVSSMVRLDELRDNLRGYKSDFHWEL